MGSASIELVKMYGGEAVPRFCLIVFLCHKFQHGVDPSRSLTKALFLSVKKCPYREIEPSMHLHYTSPVDYSKENPAHCQSSVSSVYDTEGLFYSAILDVF